MRKSLSLLAFVVLAAAMMYGQASRTWVSGVGDDANPCSRTAPCKTFAGAISKTAPGGEIDALDPGGFGAVTITKAITIDGGGGQVASVLVSGTNGIVVQAGSSDLVTLRNLRINGIGSGINGIQFNSGRALVVQNCDIFGFTNNGINVTTAGGKVSVDGTSSRNNGNDGIQVNSSANTFVNITHSQFDFNLNGVVASSFSRVTAWETSASGNSGVGFLAASTAGTAELNVANSEAANNGVGVQAGNGTTASLVRLSASTIHGNSIGVAPVTLGTILSVGNNVNSNGGTPSGPIPGSPQ